MITFNDDFINPLLAAAKSSPRRRANHNLHSSYDEAVQRLFIAMYPDSYVPVHRHSQPNKWEFFMMVRGELDILIFTEQGTLISRQTLSANGPCNGVEIPPNTWHCTVCSDPVVFAEVKQGPYQVTSDKDFASWCPPENSPDVPAFLQKIKALKVGDSLT